MAKFIVPIGAAGSGKSTAASMIRLMAQERGLIVEELAFAAPLKAFCAVVFGFDAHALYGPSAARNAEDPRYRSADSWVLAEEHMLRYGDEFIEKVLPNFDVDDYGNAVDQLKIWFNGLRSGGCLSARVALQTLGTEWGRGLYPDIWIDVAKRAVKASPADLVIATDGRFLNEAQKSGGLPVLIVRDEKTEMGALGSHASEKDQGSQEMIDYCKDNGLIIHNNGSLDDLRDELEPIVSVVAVLSKP